MWQCTLLEHLMILDMKCIVLFQFIFTSYSWDWHWIQTMYWFRIFIHCTDCRTEINRKQKPQKQQEAIIGISRVHLVMETWCQGSPQDKILSRIKMCCVGISGITEEAASLQKFIWCLILLFTQSLTLTRPSFRQCQDCVTNKPGSINYQQQLSNTRQGQSTQAHIYRGIIKKIKAFMNSWNLLVDHLIVSKSAIYWLNKQANSDQIFLTTPRSVF